MNYNPLAYWTLRGESYHLESHEGDEERGEWLEKIIHRLNPSSVLDVGCGPGKYFSRMASVPEKYAVDFSPTALQRAAMFAPHFSVNLSQMDARKLEFPSGKFDMAFTIACLVHIKEYDESTDSYPIVEAVTEICRVTSKHVLIMEYWDPQKVITELAPHCFRHDYHAMFKIWGFKLIESRPLSALIGLMIFERGGD